jgi:hypothetical protein
MRVKGGGGLGAKVTFMGITYQKGQGFGQELHAEIIKSTVVQMRMV